MAHGKVEKITTNGHLRRLHEKKYYFEVQYYPEVVMVSKQDLP